MRLPALCLLGASALLLGQSDPDAILLRALGPSPLMRNLQELCDRIGGRVTGSLAHQRALHWAQAGFRDAGVEVHLEPFTMPSRWEAGPASVEVIGPGAFKPVVTPWGWSINANGAFHLVDGGYGGVEEMRSLGARAKGAFILIRTRPLKTEADLTREFLATVTYLPLARELGAAGILSISDRPRDLLYRHIEKGDGKPSTLPELMVAREDGLRLARMLEGGQDVKLQVAMANQLGPAFETQNVVAEIPGNGLRDEIVLMGAHLDSWDLGTGALDNGCNAAMLLELARIIKASGLIPRRTLRFVLFSGEGVGFLGSRAYTERHLDELDRHRAVLIYDAGMGRVTGYSTGGQEEWFPTLQQLLWPLGEAAPREHTTDAYIGTDNYDFLLQGVPTLVANREWGPYLQDYHAQSDTLDKVDARALRDQTMEAAVLFWGLANVDHLPPRRTRPEIDATLKATRLDEDMKTFGMWDEWASGKRGRK
ncbi:MAG TPA: M28 family peptidase [Holophagaceae bacterium]|nr:M28 family peptidase [Holophagaceae bacterium]